MGNRKSYVHETVSDQRDAFSVLRELKEREVFYECPLANLKKCSRWCNCWIDPEIERTDDGKWKIITGYCDNAMFSKDRYNWEQTHTEVKKAHIEKVTKGGD